MIRLTTSYLKMRTMIPEGNFDDGSVKNIQFYRDKNGKRVVVTASRANKGQ